METSAELLYLLKFADKDDVFGFKDELERSQCLQWLFFWYIFISHLLLGLSLLSSCVGMVVVHHTRETQITSKSMPRTMDVSRATKTIRSIL